MRRRTSAFEVCLIRRKGSTSWGIPKGSVDPGDTLEKTALKEAWEEAGISGRLVGVSLGSYEYAKWDTTFEVAVYLMEVLVGLVQALVFMLLTAVFTLLICKHDEEHDQHSHAPH